jgi:hypothetical protein
MQGGGRLTATGHAVAEARQKRQDPYLLAYLLLLLTTATAGTAASCGFPMSARRPRDPAVGRLLEFS